MGEVGIWLQGGDGEAFVGDGEISALRGVWLVLLWTLLRLRCEDLVTRRFYGGSLGRVLGIGGFCLSFIYTYKS